MTLLQNGHLPVHRDPDLVTSSSSPNHHPISTKQPTPSIYNGSKQNLGDEHPHLTVASPSSSHSINALPDLAVPGIISPSTYLQSHTTSTATPLNYSMDPPHPYFRSHMIGDGLPSQQRCISLGRSHSAPDIRLVAAQPSSRYIFSNSTEVRYQQQLRSSRRGITRDIPPLNPELVSVASSPSSPDSATCSSWVYGHAEVWPTIPTSDLPPITAGDQSASPVVQYPPTLSNPFSDTVTDAWATPGLVSTPPHTAQEDSVNETSSENVQDDREHMQRMADSCKEDAKGVLILSGVLSAIVTAFLIESYKMLPPGDLGDGSSPPPAASIVWVNIMWLMSLVLSITSTLFATLALHWARRSTQLHRIPNTSRDRTHIRSFSCCGTLRYDVHHAVSMIVISLHVSLFLFLVGLVVFFFTINKLVAVVLSMAVGLFGMVYLIITVLACVDRDCPYHTPLSGLWWSQREQLGYT